MAAQSDADLQELDGIIGDFLVESYENLDRLDQELVKLEEDPSHTERLASIFRTIHTIKGGCAFLGFTKLERVSHTGEGLLSRLRDRSLVLTSDIATGLLALIDAIRLILAHIEKNRTEGDEDHGPLIALLLALQEGGRPAGVAGKDGTPVVSAPEVSPAVSPAVPPAVAPEAVASTAAALPVPPVAPEAVASAVAALPVPPVAPEAVASAVADLPVPPVAPEMLASAVAALPVPPVAPEAVASAVADSPPAVAQTPLLSDSAARTTGRVAPACFPAAQAPSGVAATSPALASPRAPEAAVQVDGAGFPPLGEYLVKNGVVTAQDVALATRRQADGDPRRLGELLMEQGVLEPQQLADALTRQVETQLATPSASDTTIRVDVNLLDRLMNLVGELVLVRNQILQVAGGRQIPEIAANAHRLNLITSELQEGVMKSRVQAIGSMLGRFPRVVRDLARTCGKQVRLEVEGSATELDRTLIEAIKDPLTHLVRNAVDHGIEPPEQRIAAGKAPEGRLLIRAYHSGGKVNLEIIDDGAGIDPKCIRAKALSRGLISPAAAETMSDHELVQLIFVPGFSTAQKVTNISGRGVGMDVVRTNIEHIGGTIEVQSKVGRGTTLKLHIPLTLAIIRAVIVTSSGGTFALPQISLVELMRLESESERRGVEWVMGAPVFRLRGELLPLVSLAGLLAGGEHPRAIPDDRAVSVAVLKTDEGQFGLVLDEVRDTQEIVVKPLSSMLKGSGVYAGATIMGDGQIALILDVAGLARRARILGKRTEKIRLERPIVQLETAGQLLTLLTFDAGAQGRMAVPLSALARIEEFPTSAIERMGPQEVFQHRSGLLPLVRLENVLLERRGTSRQGDEEPLVAGDICHVMVLSRGGRSVGVLVNRVLDVVEDRLESQLAGTRPGILGSVVLQGRVVQLLDLEYVVRSIDPGFFEQVA